MKISLLYTCLFLMSSMLYAQTAGFYRINGTVIDSSTKEIVPFVNIFVKNTMQGTTSNLDGTYEILLDNPNILKVSALGYQTKEIEITDAFLRGAKLLDIVIAPAEWDIIISFPIGGGSPSKEIYPTIDVIPINQEPMYTIVTGYRVTKSMVDEKYIFYTPNEHHLRFFLSNNR